MKKITQDADLGGAPFYKSDFREIFNEEIWDSIQAILSPFDDDVQGLIVSGCEISANGGNFNMTEGIVYLNGELMRISSVTNQSFTKYISPSSVVDDSRTFNDASINVFAETKGAELLGSSPGAGQYITISSLTSANARRWSNLLLADPFSAPDWTDITLINNWAALSETPQYYVDGFGKVHFRGRLDGSSATDEAFADIPVSATPNDLRYVCALRFTGVAVEAIIIQATVSDSKWKTSTNVDNDVVYLDNVGYWP